MKKVIKIIKYMYFPLGMWEIFNWIGLGFIILHTCNLLFGMNILDWPTSPVNLMLWVGLSAFNVFQTNKYLNQ